MNRSMVDLQKMGVGLLLGDKETFDIIRENLDNNIAKWGERVYITNCPRMKKALELCGYEVIKQGRVYGIETFMCC